MAWGSLLAGDNYNLLVIALSVIKKKKLVSLIGQSQDMTLLNAGCGASPSTCGIPAGPGGFKCFLSLKLRVSRERRFQA